MKWTAARGPGRSGRYAPAIGRRSPRRRGAQRPTALPAVTAPAAVLFAGLLLVGAVAGATAAAVGAPAGAATGAAGTPVGARPATAGPRHRPTVAADTVAVAPSAAESPAPRSTDPQPLLAVAVSVAAVAALLATRLHCRRGSPALPWGTGSTSTRGPPVLQFA